MKKFNNILIVMIIGAIFVLYGVYKERDVPQDGRMLEIWRITAYCPCLKCCGKWSDGITASGKPAQGKLIAAPPEIPFGTWIEIPGYGMAEVLDRGGSIKGRRLDVLFATHQEALEWGVQYFELEGR